MNNATPPPCLFLSQRECAWCHLETKQLVIIVDNTKGGFTLHPYSHVQVIMIQLNAHDTVYCLS